MRAQTVLVALALLGLSTDAWTAPRADELSVTYEIAPTFTLHEPIVATVTIDNSTASHVQVDLGLNKTGNFQLEPKGPFPTRRVSADDGAGGLSLVGIVGIAPGQRYQQRLLLNQWFEFERVGLYEIDIRLDSSFSKNVAAAHANTRLRFHILPRNERVLRATCARLAAIASTTRGVESAFEASRELTAVKDPVAVQHIEQVLATTDRGQFILIPALVRIGGPEAKALAERLARDADVERAALARSVVARLK